MPGMITSRLHKLTLRKRQQTKQNTKVGQPEIRQDFVTRSEDMYIVTPQKCPIGPAQVLAESDSPVSPINFERDRPRTPIQITPSPSLILFSNIACKNHPIQCHKHQPFHRPTKLEWASSPYHLPSFPNPTTTCRPRMSCGTCHHPCR